MLTKKKVTPEIITKNEIDEKESLIGDESEKNNEKTKEEKNDEEKKEPGDEEKKNPERPAVGKLSELWRYADCCDRFIFWIGMIMAILSGVNLPIFALLFSEMIDILCIAFLTPNSIPLHSNITNSTSGVEKMTEIMSGMDKMRDAGPVFAFLGIFGFISKLFKASLFKVSALRQYARFKQAYLDAVLRQDVSWFDNTNAGEIMARMTTDTTKIAEAMGDKVAILVEALGTFFFGIIVGFYISWELSLVILSLAPVMGILMAVVMKIVQKWMDYDPNADANAGGLSQQAIGAIKTVSAFSAQDHILNLYEAEQDTKYKASVGGGKNFALGLAAFMGFMYCSYALALWHGATMVIEGKNAGPLGPITGARVLAVFWVVIFGAAGLGQISPSIQAFMRGKRGAYALFQVIDRVPEIDSSSGEGKRPDKCDGALELKDVYFEYPSRPDVPIFKGYNLKIEAGHTVALVGGSGGGKSTIIKMIERFYDPTKGQVLLDGNNLKDLNVQWLRDQMGLVSQEPLLFSTSIMENIRNGKRGATEDEVREAAKMANAHDFITKFPKGYDTLVGERGTQLSGGEKQRVAIARAIIRDPKILLLDEATSALDSVSEGVVQEALDSLMKLKKRTTVVVAHRLSTIQDADKIAVIHEGAIVEEGTHNELSMIENGYYANLVALQNIGKQGGSTDDHDKIIEKLPVDLVRQYSSKESKESKLRESSISRARSSKEEEKVEIEDNIFNVNLSKVDPTKLKDYDLEGMSVTKRCSPSSATLRLLKMNKPDWPYLLMGTLLGLGNGLVNPMMAILLSGMLATLCMGTNKADHDQMRHQADVYSLLFVALGLYTFIVSLSGWPMGIAAARRSRKLRRRLLERILHLDIGFHDGVAPGVLNSQLVGDIGVIDMAHEHSIPMIINIIGAIISVSIITFYFSWQLTLALIVVSPLMILPGYLSGKMWKKSEAIDESKDVEAKLITETVTSAQEVTALQLQPMIRKLYADTIEIPLKREMRKSWILAFSEGISQLLNVFVYIVIFVVGAWLIDRELIDLDKFLIVSMCMMFGAGNASAMAANLPNRLKADVAAGRIFRILDKESTIDSSSDEGERPARCNGHVELRNVDFSYPSRPDVIIFKNYNLIIEPGQTVALVGESGGGKSTVINLVERFYDPTKGEVLLDGSDLRTLNVQWLRNQIGLVSQEPVLFKTSILENIKYGKRSATEDEAIMAAKMANAHDFVMEFDKKYETGVGERGIQLSGGQKQRIAIARAIIRDPTILLLDEATSALDSVSERIVQKALDSLLKAKRRTTIIVAHRLATIQEADAIAVIYDGAIVEKGTHQELIQKEGGHYQRLSRRQQNEKSAEEN